MRSMRGRGSDDDDMGQPAHILRDMWDADPPVVSTVDETRKKPLLYMADGTPLTTRGVGFDTRRKGEEG